MEATEIFERNYDSTAKIVINRGGTRSSKTWSLNQLCALWLISGNYGNGMYVSEGVWTTVRKYRTNLDGTVIRDFEDILKAEDWYNSVDHNKTKKQFKDYSFSQINKKIKTLKIKYNLLFGNRLKAFKFLFQKPIEFHNFKFFPFFFLPNKIIKIFF